MHKAIHFDYRRSNSIEDLLMKLPRRTLKELIARVRRASPKAGLTYIDEEGKVDIIPLTLRPRLVSPPVFREIQHIILTLNCSFEKLAFLYRDVPQARPIFTFTERENSWVEDILPHLDPRRTCLVSRWDANTGFGTQDWRESFCFFEVNGVGIGGLWYASAAADMILRFVMPELHKVDGDLKVKKFKDLYRILFESLTAHRRRLGRTKGILVLMMDKAEGTNYVEFERLAKLYSSWGVKTKLAGPAELEVKAGELYLHGAKVDLVYRDTQLSEFCTFEEKGHDLEAVRHGFRKGQLVSTFEGEFDHKSAFEVFTDPEFYRYFSAREIRLFKRYILWTRLVREIKTVDPKGRAADLPAYMFKHQSTLVLKPNRSFGGKGIVFGEKMTRAAWQRKIEKIIRQGEDWVVQEVGQIRTKRFLNPRKSEPRETELYIASGFFAAKSGLGIVGRVARDPIVNVARGGGLSPILLVTG